MKKSLLIAASAATIGLASIAGVGLASASSHNGQDGLVDKLVAKFHLNKSEVQSVFDAQRTENQAERQAEMKTRLETAVKDGKLTQAQADAITAHQASEQSFRDSLKDKTPEERQAAMKDHRASEQQWAKDNGIPAGFLRPDGMGHGPRGGGMGHMGEDKPMSN